MTSSMHKGKYTWYFKDRGYLCSYVCVECAKNAGQECERDEKGLINAIVKYTLSELTQSLMGIPGIL